MRLSSFELSNDEIQSLGEVTATVRLDRPAPFRGCPVMLGSSDEAIKVPARVVIPPGEQSYTFTIEADTLLHLVNYHVWAQVEETVFRRKLILKQAGLGSIAFEPTIVDGGNTVTLRITLDSPAPVTGALVLLSEVLNYDGEPLPLLTDLPLSVYFADTEQEKTTTVTTRDWDGGRMPAPRQVNTAVDAVLESVSKRAILTITDP